MDERRIYVLSPFNGTPTAKPRGRRMSHSYATSGVAFVFIGTRVLFCNTTWQLKGQRHLTRSAEDSFQRAICGEEFFPLGEAQRGVGQNERFAYEDKMASCRNWPVRLGKSSTSRKKGVFASCRRMLLVCAVFWHIIVICQRNLLSRSDFLLVTATSTGVIRPVPTEAPTIPLAKQKSTRWLTNRPVSLLCMAWRELMG